MQVKHNQGIITLFVTQRQCVHALPLTSFPTDNIRQHALHTHVFNCLLGFWSLTHNLCSQLLVSHFSFVLSFTSSCCYCSCWSRCLQNTVCRISTDVYMPGYPVNFSAEAMKLNEWWLNAMLLLTQSFIMSPKPLIITTLFQSSICILGK